MPMELANSLFMLYFVGVAVFAVVMFWLWRARPPKAADDKALPKLRQRKRSPKTAAQMKSARLAMTRITEATAARSPRRRRWRGGTPYSKEGT
ncbi:MAG: hypothetical protein M3Y55_00460 [Pseudomonadota bacterium]|nr:hypothetical protein [Pseudomonadota bacterium]